MEIKIAYKLSFPIWNSPKESSRITFKKKVSSQRNEHRLDLIYLYSTLLINKKPTRHCFQSSLATLSVQRLTQHCQQPHKSSLIYLRHCGFILHSFLGQKLRSGSIHTHTQKHVPSTQEKLELWCWFFVSFFLQKLFWVHFNRKWHKNKHSNFGILTACKFLDESHWYYCYYRLVLSNLSLAWILEEAHPWLWFLSTWARQFRVMVSSRGHTFCHHGTDWASP